MMVKMSDDVVGELLSALFRLGALQLMLARNRIQTAWSVDRLFAAFFFADVSRARNATPI
jgi:hypothetical protein